MTIVTAVTNPALIGFPNTNPAPAGFRNLESGTALLSTGHFVLILQRTVLVPDQNNNIA